LDCNLISLPNHMCILELGMIHIPPSTMLQIDIF
jgi:hypothetical protein